MIPRARADGSSMEQIGVETVLLLSDTFPNRGTSPTALGISVVVPRAASAAATRKSTRSESCIYTEYMINKEVATNAYSGTLSDQTGIPHKAK